MFEHKSFALLLHSFTLRLTKMRKLLMLLSFLCLTLSAFSQKGVEVGVFWSPQVYRILNEDDINFLQYKNFPISISNLGGWISFNPKRGVGLYIGAIQALQGQEYSGGVAQTLLPRTLDNLGRIQLSYFKFPVLFQVRRNAFQGRTTQQRKLGINFMLGPQLNWLNKVSWKDNQNQEIKITDGQGEQVNLLDAYDRFNLNLAIAMGLNYPVTRKLAFTLLIKTDYSLEDIENKSFLIDDTPFYFLKRLPSTNLTFSVQPSLSWILNN